MNARDTRTIGVLLALSGLAGCGGGQQEDMQRGAATMLLTAAVATATGEAKTQAVSSVQIEGCVVDRHFIPAEGNVEALQADGRAVAHGYADARGIFRLRVPPDTSLRVRLAHREGSDELEVWVRRHDVSIAACLIDEPLG